MSHQQAEPSLLRVHTCFHDRVAVVVVVEGELDLSTTPLLEEQIVDALGRGAEDVVIDLRRLDFMDSSGIHFLLGVAARSRRTGFGLSIAGARGPVLRALQIVRADSLLPLER